MTIMDNDKKIMILKRTIAWILLSLIIPIMCGFGLKSGSVDYWFGFFVGYIINFGIAAVAGFIALLMYLFED